MTPPETSMLQLELERLRGAVDTGFATLNGRLDVVLQRQTQAERDIQDVEAKHEADIIALRQHVDTADREIRTEVDGIKRQVWMAAGGVSVLVILAGVLAPLLLS